MSLSPGGLVVSALENNISVAPLPFGGETSQSGAEWAFCDAHPEVRGLRLQVLEQGSVASSNQRRA